jgi:hypothetical protein
MKRLQFMPATPETIALYITDLASRPTRRRNYRSPPHGNLQGARCCRTLIASINA